MTDVDTAPAEDDPTTSTAASPEAADRDDAAERRRVLSRRLALGVFVAYLVVAYVLVLGWLGRDQWFAGDEWDFLANRSATDVGDLLRPYNQHISTVPILVFQFLFGIFGLTTYLPYQAVVCALHLVSAFLVRVVMRRVGVGPWVATCAAASFVLLGPARANITWAFQIGFAGALVLGLVHLILADHDGPLDRRDALGLAAGLVGLLFVGLGPVLAFVVGLAALLRRGWRPALFHSVPIWAAYGLWYLAVGRDAGTGNTLSRPGPRFFAEWWATGERATFEALGHFPVVALLLAVLLVVGLALAWLPFDWSRFRVQSMVPALLAGSVVFQAAVSYQRYFLNVDGSKASHYLHVLAAFTLPGLALAAATVIRRWRVLAPPVLLLFLLPIPWNADEIRGGFDAAFYRGIEKRVVMLGYSPLLTQIDPDVHPDSTRWGIQRTTAGWLAQAAADGKLPPPQTIDPITRSSLTVQFGVSQEYGPLPPGLTCADYEELTLQPKKGDQLVIESGVQIATTNGTKANSLPIGFDPYLGRLLTIELPDLHLLVQPLGRAEELRLCR